MLTLCATDGPSSRWHARGAHFPGQCTGWPGSESAKQEGSVAEARAAGRSCCLWHGPFTSGALPRSRKPSGRRPFGNRVSKTVLRTLSPLLRAASAMRSETRVCANASVAPNVSTTLRLRARRSDCEQAGRKREHQRIAIVKQREPKSEVIASTTADKCKRLQLADDSFSS